MVVEFTKFMFEMSPLENLYYFDTCKSCYLGRFDNMHGGNPELDNVNVRVSHHAFQ